MQDTQCQPVEPGNSFKVFNTLFKEFLWKLRKSSLTEALTINCSVADKTVKDYSVYKANLLYFGLLDALPNVIFKVEWNILFEIY